MFLSVAGDWKKKKFNIYDNLNDVFCDTATIPRRTTWTSWARSAAWPTWSSGRAARGSERSSAASWLEQTSRFDPSHELTFQVFYFYFLAWIRGHPDPKLFVDSRFSALFGLVKKYFWKIRTHEIKVGSIPCKKWLYLFLKRIVNLVFVFHR